jgi:hypothetical protein
VEREGKVERGGWRRGGEGAERIRGVEKTEKERERDMNGWRKGLMQAGEGVRRGKIRERREY